MRRYYFDAVDGAEHYSDEQGLPLGDDDAACDAARQGLMDMVRHGCGSDRTMSITVRDDTGASVYAAVLTVRGLHLR